MRITITERRVRDTRSYSLVTASGARYNADTLMLLFEHAKARPLAGASQGVSRRRN